MYSTGTATAGANKTVSFALANAISIPPSTPIIFYADATAVAGALGTYGDGKSGVSDWNFEKAVADTGNSNINQGTGATGYNGVAGVAAPDGKASCFVDMASMGFRQ